VGEVRTSRDPGTGYCALDRLPVTCVRVYQIAQVPDDVPDLPEQLGTRPKFWFLKNRQNFLFKEARSGTGEDWSEKTSSELATLLDLPHATYDLAVWRRKRGVITPSFVPEGASLVHGNELIARLVKGYEVSATFRTSQHTIGRVFTFVSLPVVGPPLDFTTTPGLRSGADVFVGYLMLDAWIANQDRHHENWGLVRTEEGNIHLAPSYDHASSLGRNEMDAKRRARLDSRDPAHSMLAYVARARSAFYSGVSDRRPLPCIDAFRWAASKRPGAAREWLDRLANLETGSVTRVFQSIPDALITEAGREFALSILSHNKQRLMKTREELS